VIPISELEALITLNRLPAGGQKLIALLQQGISPASILSQIKHENLWGKGPSLEILQNKFSAEREIEVCAQKSVRFLTILDPHYPSRLKEISDPPLVLYVKGDILETDTASVAIVGSRHPSFYGNQQAKKISRDLAESGLTIVSGMARGIDQAAHEAALTVPFGRSIAVLGCGIDRIYPPENKKIYEQLCERGAVISEYAFGTAPLAENFPRRNRIISGLALAVLVIEAHSRSGSLITAHQALDQGREVFAMPGPVDQLTSKGTHSLIREGANLLESAQDVIEVLNPVLWPLIPSGNRTESTTLTDTKVVPKPETEALCSADPEERGILELMTKEPLLYDEILSRSSIPVNRLGPVLSRLELGHKVRRNLDGRFALLKTC